jgi:hypothetical protein
MKSLVNIAEIGGAFYLLYRTNKTIAYVAAVPLLFIGVMATIAGRDGGYVHDLFLSKRN